MKLSDYSEDELKLSLKRALRLKYYGFICAAFLTSFLVIVLDFPVFLFFFIFVSAFIQLGSGYLVFEEYLKRIGKLSEIKAATSSESAKMQIGRVVLIVLLVLLAAYAGARANAF